MFLVLFPIRRTWISLLALLCGSLAIAFFTNVLRVVVLSLSSKQCEVHWWTQWCGFEFWHLGTGSHLFSFLAVTGVCALWWWDIQQHDSCASPEGRN